MAFITLNKEKLRHNYHYLNNLFAENKVEWAVVSKILCGNKLFLQELVDLGVTEVCDSRISNLAKVKELNPNINTVYIKPPAKRSIERVVQYADVSFNTEHTTIEMLSKEAKRQGKTHRVVIMIELGDLREGIMGDHLIDFYSSVFELPNIEVIGIGTNLNCLHGTMPSQDKLIQLALYKQIIEIKFNKKIPWVSGGTSVVIPLMEHKQMPKAINHFRVGETLFFGNDLVEEVPYEAMKQDVFMLYAEIIEITEKPSIPIGELAENPSGEMYEVNEEDYGRTSHRAIIDVGLLDVGTDFLIPEDEKLTIIGASSDMLVLDIEETERDYKVGDLISFKLKYMGALSLFNSDYIEKRVI